MLEKLIMRNFALIEQLEVDLPPGFTVLTGETGAGKSIIIDAVSVVTGGPGLTEYIRSGEVRAMIEAVFNITSNKRTQDILEENGLSGEPGEPLILGRELSRTGKNVCRVNGRQVSLAVLREIAETLIDIYGQHHQQSLLNPRKHIELLDEYGGAELLQVRAETTALYQELHSLQTRLRNMEENARERTRKIDLYRYELKEIELVNPFPDEDLALAEEKNLLANTQRLSVLYRAAYDLLYEGSAQRAVTELLHEALNNLREAAALDQYARPLGDTLAAVLYQ
ncbi:MAG: AAA family ATPase, partial [bacterium]|nr:AAA family ATPase [bacterium]